MTVHVYEQEGNGHKENMLELAERVEEHYTSPSPQATAYAPNFFPRALDHGILWGLLLGALVGVFLGWLVHSGRLTPHGWEGLFSLVPFTFYAFWAFVGAALGLTIGGIVTLLLVEPPPLEELEEPETTS